MSLLEQQNFLALLYTDSDLRQKFLSEPENTGRKYDLTEHEIKEIAEVLPEELNFFADSLFWKRLREVEKILPLTKDFSGEDFRNLFREFSQNYTPQTIKKHLEDAVEFCRFLQHAKISEIVKDAAKFEQAKLEFFNRKMIFKHIYLSHDLNTSTAQKNFTFWLKIGNKIYHRTIYFLPFRFDSVK